MGDTSAIMAHLLSCPGPKEASVEANVYASRGCPLTHTLYRAPGNADPNATPVPYTFHGYPYHGPSNARYTPHNQHPFGYPYRGMDVDRVHGESYEGPTVRETGASQVADHRAYYNGARDQGAAAARNTARPNMPLRSGNPSFYGMGFYENRAYPVAPNLPIPEHEWARGAKYMNGTVEYGPLTTTAVKQPIN